MLNWSFKSENILPNCHSMQKRISVVVPVYNVEQFLRECLDSLYKQYDETKDEVILVNDGSTDGSLEICRKYETRYKGTVVLDKPNGGLSDARNAGTELASGEYVYYLDSDDILGENALSTLYDFAIKYGCDIVQGGFYYYYSDHLLFDTTFNKMPSPILFSRAEAMERLIENHSIKNFAWGKLYKSSIVKKYSFPKGRCFEDSYWQHLIVNEVNSYGVISSPLYYYRQRECSISGRFSIRNLDLLRGYEERLAFVATHYPNLLTKAAKVYWQTAYSFYSIAMSTSQEELKKAYGEYWKQANEKYRVLFQKALNRSLTYRLVESHSVLLPLWSLAKRAVNRLRGSSIKRIDF